MLQMHPGSFGDQRFTSEAPNSSNALLSLPTRVSLGPRGPHQTRPEHRAPRPARDGACLDTVKVRSLSSAQCLTCENPFSSERFGRVKKDEEKVKLEAKGGAKASAPEWESGGQRGRKKHGALFGGRGEESFICGSLPGSSCERRERRETERRETERRERERERGERDERDEKEMREMREMRETVRQ